MSNSNVWGLIRKLMTSLACYKFINKKVDKHFTDKIFELKKISGKIWKTSEFFLPEFFILICNSSHNVQNISTSDAPTMCKIWGFKKFWKMIFLNIFSKNIFLIFNRFSFSIFCPWSADKLWLLMSNIEMPSKSKGGAKRSYLLKTFSCRAVVASKSIFGFLPKNGHFSILKLLWKTPLKAVSQDRQSPWSARARIALCEFWDLTV